MQVKKIITISVHFIRKKIVFNFVYFLSPQFLFIEPSRMNDDGKSKQKIQVYLGGS